MRIAILDAGTFYFDNDEPWAPLAEFGELVIHQHTKHDDADLILEHCKGCEVVLTNKVPLTAETLARLPELKAVWLSMQYDKAGKGVANVRPQLIKG